MTPWLLAGALLHFGAHLSPAAPLLGFVALAPWVKHVDERRSRRDHLVFFATMLLTWVACGAHLRTNELPFVAGPAAGLVAFLMRAPAWLLYLVLRDRLPSWASALSLAALLVLSDTAQPLLTPLASWGSAGYVVLEDRALLQMVALTGLSGPAFLAYATASLVGHTLASRPAPRTSAIIAGTLVLAHLVGTERLAAIDRHLPTTRVATVDTTYRPSGLRVPSARELEAQLAKLESGLADAARAGAELVVFPEVAVAVAPDAEAALLDRFDAMARTHHVALVAGWGVAPPRVRGAVYENRSVWIDENGARQLVHEKERPAPGEPIVSGPPLAKSVDTEFGRGATAICYDGSHPDLGRQRARLGIALLAIPSSDWRGISPTHSEMAVVRGVEGGYAIVRSTRYGTSLASDAWGRIVARHDDGNPSRSVMLADVVTMDVVTPYERFGEWLTALCALFVLGLVAFALRSSQRVRSAAQRAA